MLDTLDVWIIYYAGCFCLFCLGMGLQFGGRRGRFSRALVLAAFTGALVPVMAYLTYQPPPPPPPVQVDPHTPLLQQLTNGLGQAAAAGVGEAIARNIGPLIYGAVSILAAFLISLLFPCRGRRNLPAETAIGLA